MTDAHAKPIKSNHWCPNGCQPLYELGECGMCGYEGDGVHQDETSFVVDACEETGAYTRQTPEGLCYGCGKQHGPEHAIALFGATFHLTLDHAFYVARAGEEIYAVPVANADGLRSASTDELAEHLWCPHHAIVMMDGEPDEVAALQALFSSVPESPELPDIIERIEAELEMRRTSQPRHAPAVLDDDLPF
ncbi:hypothetical protein [Roseicella aquatilis]|uniref:Uncharacterized protein n=1 Tax=Roseicella aquatilis TaxID=2527868 RepID=A0A4V2WJT1_9PROT|nr:hypothetical protein [Roseicella aquatilis]TCZ55778.1 hypothetical protein EXY23_20835 [Roseicella aquatilis]